jgi:hypothetical protein
MMKSIWILAISIAWLNAFTSCSKADKSTHYRLKCDTLLRNIEESYSAFVPKNEGKDSQGIAMNLTTLRYELQGYQYEIESMRVPAKDSLFWVGALRLAVTYFSLSWELLPLTVFPKFDPESPKIQIEHEINKRKKEGILFYLQYARQLPKGHQDYWNKLLNQKS